MEHHAKIVPLLDGTLCINIPTQDGSDRVDLKNIVYLKGERSQTTFFLKDGKKIVASNSLMYWAKSLLKHGFVRIHNSYVINFLFYSHYQKGDPGHVIVNGTEHLTVSTNFREDFINYLYVDISEENSTDKDYFEDTPDVG